MFRQINEEVLSDWSELISAENSSTLKLNLELVQQHGDELAGCFYDSMMQDKAAKVFLSHEMVKTRLHASMKNWLVHLFNVSADHDLQATVAEQIKIGEIHARVDVPVHLVLRGARCLKDCFNDVINQHHLEPKQVNDGYQLFCDLVDIAMEVMSQAYVYSHDRNSRADEAYRLFSVSQNLSFERDRQRAALLDWENKLMYECAAGRDASHFPKISLSEFGLWYRHKGSHAFQGSSEAVLISDEMQEIDDVLLPLFNLETSTTEQRLQNLRDLRDKTKSIRFHLEHLFERNSEIEGGRDVLTRLLNRKFLSTVLTREVAYTREHDSQFALLALDIDHFKQVNDTYGHEAGDMVLQQLASILVNLLRGGDFVFRLGGEEFLILLVDVHQQGAMQVAEKLRRQIEQEVFFLPEGRDLKTTVSIGVAIHSGHPDYQATMRLADEALYEAKHNGRNCVVLKD